jgi:hypothetical protein
MKKPEKCCLFGEFKCTVPIPINRRVQKIDLCISHIVAALNAGGIVTLASCCGHGKQDGDIQLEDGVELIVKRRKEHER